MLWLYAHRYVSDPHEAVQLEDQEESWTKLLNAPDVVADDDGKEAASVLCGASYFDDVSNRDKEGVDCVTCLVLDVDNDDPATSTGLVPDEMALRSALGGLRAIVYTSPSHTRQKPRWRVLLPLASPLPPKKHRALVKLLSDTLVPGYAGCIDAVSTGDPTRLGFVCVTKNPDDYKWFTLEGALFDWTAICLEDEDWIDAPLGGLDRKAGWTDRATALQAALRTYAYRGYEDVKDGEHRTDVLWHAAMALWWDWAAEDEDFVMTVLRSINEQFPEAKNEEEIERKQKEAHGRTVGPNRKAQLNGPYGGKREPGNAVSVAAIKHLAKRLRRSHKPAVARVGDEMSRMICGTTIADDPDTWRSALGRVAQSLAEHFIHDKRERIAGFFQPALAAMIASGGETAVPALAEITGWIGTRLDGAKKRRAENEARAEASVRQNIAAATGGKRDTKYTPEEWDTWQAPNGCGLSDKSVLLQAGKGTWVFLDGTWVGPYTESEFDAQGYTNLEAAQDFVRSKTFNEEKGTWTCVPLRQLLQKHGSSCEVLNDFTCERTWFRAEDHTLVVAGAALAQLDAKFHTIVDEWLRRMTGRATPANEKKRQDEAAASSVADNYADVCNWLACLPQVEHPCAALVVTGPGGTGKDLFATGVGRIWRNGKSTMEATMGHFNAMLAKSPLIHVNENRLPRGMNVSTLLRATLSAVEHVVTRKNVDSGKVHGCVRMLFTANNLDIFGGNEKLKADDVNALQERFVYIYTRPEARTYLEGSLTAAERHAIGDHMLAEHALWLNERRWSGIKARGHRFLVQGRNAVVSDVVATNENAASDVCNTIAEALVECRPADFFVVRNGNLWVSATLLKRQICLQNPSARYSDRDVTRAVSSVSTKRQTVHGLKKRMKMRLFRTDALETWCRNTEVYDWEDVQAGMAKMNRQNETEV